MESIAIASFINTVQAHARSAATPHFSMHALQVSILPSTQLLCQIKHKCTQLSIVKVQGGDILTWALDEDTLGDKISQVSYTDKVTLDTAV